MKTNKLFATCMAITLAASMAVSFTSCGGSDKADTSKADDKSTAATDENKKETADKTTLTFMGWEASPLETAAVENGIKAFEAATPGVTVKYTPTGSGDDYNAKLLSSIAGNSQPDVFFCAADSYRGYVSKKALLDITDKFSKEFPLDDFIDSSKTIMQVDSKVYGISSCTVNPVVYYNKDIFDAAGVPYPSSEISKTWTIDEFRETAKKLTKDGVYGCYGLEQMGGMINVQILSGGGQRYNEDYTKCAINTPEAKKVLTTIRDVREVDKSAPAASTLENAGMNAAQMLQTGKVAMLLDGSWALQQLSTMDFPIGIAPAPSYGKPISLGQAHLHCIGTQTKHEDEAWKFLTFLAGMDYQGALCKEGLWMPNRKSMYEPGAKGLDGWYDEKRLGTDYKNMLDYFKNCQVDPQALTPLSVCNDIFLEETDKFFKEGQDVDTTCKTIETRTNEALAEIAK